MTSKVHEFYYSPNKFDFQNWAVDQKLMINLVWSNVSQACTELSPPPLAACHTANIQSWIFSHFTYLYFRLDLRGATQTLLGRRQRG